MPHQAAIASQRFSDTCQSKEVTQPDKYSEEWVSERAIYFFNVRLTCQNFNCTVNYGRLSLLDALQIIYYVELYLNVQIWRVWGCFFLHLKWFTGNVSWTQAGIDFTVYFFLSSKYVKLLVITALLFVFYKKYFDNLFSLNLKVNQNIFILFIVGGEVECVF